MSRCTIKTDLVLAGSAFLIAHNLRTLLRVDNLTLKVDTQSIGSSCSTSVQHTSKLDPKSLQRHQLLLQGLCVCTSRRRQFFRIVGTHWISRTHSWFARTEGRNQRNTLRFCQWHILLSRKGIFKILRLYTFGPWDCSPSRFGLPHFETARWSIQYNAKWKTSARESQLQLKWDHANYTKLPDTNNIEAFFTRDYNILNPGYRKPHRVGVQGGFLVIKPNLEIFET